MGLTNKYGNKYMESVQNRRDRLMSIKVVDLPNEKWAIQRIRSGKTYAQLTSGVQIHSQK